MAPRQGVPPPVARVVDPQNARDAGHATQHPPGARPRGELERVRRLAGAVRLLCAEDEGARRIRDLLELVVWEDYGLFSRVDGFLRALPEERADLAMRALARIIAELRAADLDRQVAKARTLRQVVLQAAGQRRRRKGGARDRDPDRS